MECKYCTNANILAAIIMYYHNGCMLGIDPLCAECAMREHRYEVKHRADVWPRGERPMPLTLYAAPHEVAALIAAYERKARISAAGRDSQDYDEFRRLIGLTMQRNGYFWNIW